MALTNFTEDGSHKNFKQLFCSEELTARVQYQLIFLAALNIFLSISSFLGNILILVALKENYSLHPPSKLLFRTLAITDLCVGIIAEPLLVIYLMSALEGRWNICRTAKMVNFITGYILCSVSLFTLTVISLDRLLSLLLGLRYKQVATLKRTYLTVTAGWVVSILGTTMCFYDYLITLWYSYIGILLGLLISIFCYAKIFLTLRQHNTQVQDMHVHQGKPTKASLLNLKRYRKLVSSTLWLQLTLLICYLPYGIMDVLITRRGLSSSFRIAREFTVTLVYLNSSINPIVYC